MPDPLHKAKKIRGRGKDYELRFKTSQWAENLLIEGLNDAELLVVRLGLSAIGEKNIIEIQDPSIKVPDLLIFARADLSEADIAKLPRDLSLLPADILSSAEYVTLVGKARAAIEVEFSPYKASQMAGRSWVIHTEEKMAKRLLKHAKPPTAPNIWIKEEDLSRLKKWERSFKVPIVVVHVFDEEAFAIPLEKIYEFDSAYTARDEEGKRKLQLGGGIFKKLQTYDRVDAQGAREQKWVFVVSPATAWFAGKVQNVIVEAQLDISASKKYIAHPIFKGGNFELADDFVSQLLQLKLR